MLKVKNVNKSYRNEQALKNISLTIPEWRCYRIIGPNGAGKSTLMKIMTTITRSDSGDVTFNKQPIQEDVKQKIGYIPQVICLEQTISAQENLFQFIILYI